MPKIEIEQDEYDKLTQKAKEHDNYKLAVQDERQKRKDAEKEVTDLKILLDDAVQSKTKLESDLTKTAGDKDKAIQEKDTLIAELQGKVAIAESKATKYDEGLNASLNEKLEKIPEERKEFVKSALDGKDHETQVKLLDGFIEDYTSKDFVVKPKKEGDVIVDQSEFNKAKEKGDIQGMIAHAPEMKIEE